MMRKQKKGQWKYAAYLFLLVLAAGLLLDTKGTTQAAQTGIVLCMETVIPSLFPFFVLSGLIIKLQVADQLQYFADRTICRMFGINRELACAYLLGLIGGYPIGARTVAELYKQKKCTKIDAQRVLSYCNNCGPAFMIAVVGNFLFQSPAVGWILYGIHVVATVIVALLHRKQNNMEPKYVKRCVNISASDTIQAFLTSVNDGFTNIMHVSAFVILFSVLIHIGDSFSMFAFLAKPFSLFAAETEAIATLHGLMEITCGMRSLASISNRAYSLVACSFLLGFGGICVFCQTASLLSDAKLSIRTYAKGKLIHGSISAGITMILLPLLLQLCPAQETVLKTVSNWALLPIPMSLLIFSCVLLMIAGFLYMHAFLKKRLSKH